MCEAAWRLERAAKVLRGYRRLFEQARPKIAKYSSLSRERSLAMLRHQTRGKYGEIIQYTVQAKNSRPLTGVDVEHRCVHQDVDHPVRI